MNILNVLYNFCAGGVERLAIDVSNQMAKMGNDTHLCVISGNYSEELLNQVSENVHVHLLRKGKYRKIKYVVQILDLIDSYKIEVMHVHQGTLMNFFWLIKVLRPKVRLYFTSHDTFIFSGLSKKDQKIAVFICNKIIAISDAVVEDITSQRVNRNKVYRVYNGVNFSRFSLCERNINISREIVIVNVARFFPAKKGQDVLIRATAILHSRGYNVRTRFAGGEVMESKGEIQRMRELAVELNINNQIDFLGNIDNVMEFLRTADIFCIPSRYEGFGISAVEAMATGLPCVASNIIGLNEVVNDDCLGRLFETQNEKDLADQLEYVILHRSEFDAKIIAENVRGRFSIVHMCEELMNVYRI